MNMIKRWEDLRSVSWVAATPILVDRRLGLVAEMAAAGTADGMGSATEPST